MSLRENAIHADVYNSGLLVFLYDAANTDAINELAPELLMGFAGKNDLNDAALKAAGEQGLLVAYELRQDDELSIDVIVGEPLTADEMAPLAWWPVQTSRLSLPSGQLHIDSYDSLRLGDEDPTDEGGTLSLPAGDYLLTLHRINYDGLEAKGIEGYRDAQEIIILTPLTEENQQATLPLLLFPVG